MDITTYLLIAAVVAAIVGLVAVEREDKPVAYVLQCAGVGLLWPLAVVIGVVVGIWFLVQTIADGGDK